MSKYIESPELGGHRVAYSACGDMWVVDAFCYADGGAPEGVGSLESLLRDFDWSGAIRQELQSGRLGADDIIVGVHAQDCEDDVICAIWGKELRYRE